VTGSDKQTGMNT